MIIDIVHEDEVVHTYKSDMVPHQGELIVVCSPDGKEDMYQVDVVSHEVRLGSSGNGVQSKVELIVSHENTYIPDESESNPRKGWVRGVGN